MISYLLGRQLFCQTKDIGERIFGRDSPSARTPSAASFDPVRCVRWVLWTKVPYAATCSNYRDCTTLRSIVAITGAIPCPQAPAICAGGEGMQEPLPDNISSFKTKHPAVWEAFARLGQACHETGPLDEKTRRLVKLGMAIAFRHEGAVHSAVRNALQSA